MIKAIKLIIILLITITISCNNKTFIKDTVWILNECNWEKKHVKCNTCCEGYILYFGKDGFFKRVHSCYHKCKESDSFSVGPGISIYFEGTWSLVNKNIIVATSELKGLAIRFIDSTYDSSNIDTFYICKKGKEKDIYLKYENYFYKKFDKFYKPFLLLIKKPGSLI